MIVKTFLYKVFIRCKSYCLNKRLNYLNVLKLEYMALVNDVITTRPYRCMFIVLPLCISNTNFNLTVFMCGIWVHIWFNRSSSPFYSMVYMRSKWALCRLLSASSLLSSTVCPTDHHGLCTGAEPHCGRPDHVNEEISAVCGSTHRY